MEERDVAEYLARARVDRLVRQKLLERGVINKVADGVNILGNGELTKKLNVKVNAYSESAKEKIEALGGTAEVI